MSLAYNVEWSEEIFYTFFDKWDFNFLSGNSSFCWSIGIFNKHIDKWNFNRLIELRTFPWSDSLLKEHKQQVDIDIILKSSNNYLSSTFIEENKDLITWNGKFRMYSNYRYEYEAAPISINRNVEISISTLREKAANWEMGDKVYTNAGESCREAPGEWYYFSYNKYLTTQHLQSFADNLSWDVLSTREDLEWSVALLYQFKDYWNWKIVFENKAVIDKVLIPNSNRIKLYFLKFNYVKQRSDFIKRDGFKNYR
jgi:hypothetical protein